MFLSDYHLHSCFSFDCSQTIEEIAREAAQKQLREIAVTDHAELAAGASAAYLADLSEAAQAIDRAAQRWSGRLTIRKGVELGNAHLAPQAADEIARGFSGDFIIGSVHNIQPEQDVAYCDYTKTDPDKMLRAYFDAVKTVAETADYDVLGHLTYPLKAIFEQTGTVPDLRRYTAQLESIFTIVAARGKGIEVNTSGLRCRLGKLLPDAPLLRLYRQCGGRCVTVGSDAHRPQDVGAGICEAAERLKECGFAEITTFEKRRPIPRPIETSGTA